MAPTEVPTGVEGDRASEVGDRTLEEPTEVPGHLALASPFVVEAEAAIPSVGEPEALARKQRLVLDKACRCLGDQGFGTLESASKRAS